MAGDTGTAGRFAPFPAPEDQRPTLPSQSHIHPHTLYPSIGNLLRHKREAVTWLSPV